MDQKVKDIINHKFVFSRALRIGQKSKSKISFESKPPLPLNIIERFFEIFDSGDVSNTPVLFSHRTI